MSTERRNKIYGGRTAFIDLLFNVLIGFVFMFILAFLLINPISKKKDIEEKAEYVITMTWPKHLDDDLDLWLETPDNKIVYFKNREQPMAHLDRDDLGHRTDKIQTSTGEFITFLDNKERITIRGVTRGEYTVAVHYYSNHRSGDHTDEESNAKQYMEGFPVEVLIEKLNPYAVVDKHMIKFRYEGQMETYIRFTLDAEGNVSDWNRAPKDLMKKDAEIQGRVLSNQYLNGNRQTNGGVSIP
jgi:hypothetical protein